MRFRLSLLLFIILVPLCSAAVDYDWEDAWALGTGHGSIYDKMTWLNTRVDLYPNYMNTETDCICFDYCDSGASDDSSSTWDECFCDHGYDNLANCNLNIPLFGNILASKKNEITTFDTRFIQPSDFASGRVCYSDMVEFIDCDNSAGARQIRHMTDQGEQYYVADAQRYYCNGIYVNYHGYAGAWYVIESNNGLCDATEECDPNHDLISSSSKYSRPSSPCRTKDGFACSLDDDCLSDNCVSGYCATTVEICANGQDDDGDGKIDCDDSDCEGVEGPNGYICCNDENYECATCTICSYDECVYEPAETICNENYLCSDSSSYDNSYGVSDFLRPAQGMCDGNGNCDYTKPIRNSCDQGPSGIGEDGSISTCVDGQSTCKNSCEDGIDNDNDGLMDGADDDCQDSEPQCSGKIEVVVMDEISLDSAKYVYLDNQLQGTTSNIGEKEISIGSSSCTNKYEVMVQCSNGGICDTKYTQMDLEGDTDRINFDCTKCSTEDDLSISNSDVWVNEATQDVTIGILSEGITGNVQVAAFVYDEGEYPDSTSVAVSVVPGMNYYDINGLTFTEDQYIQIQIDSTDAFVEDSTNNYIFRPVTKSLKAKFNINSGLEGVNLAIEEFLGSFFYEDDANPEIAINVKILPERFMGLAAYTAPFVAAVERPRVTSGDPEITIYAKGYEGAVAGVKKLINARSVYLDFKDRYNSHIEYVDNYDPLGIKVVDQFQTTEARELMKFTEGQEEITKRILFDNNFEVSVKQVKTTDQTSYGYSTILRLKNMNTDYTKNYREVFGITSTPVVMSGGLFSDITTWEDGLGKDLVEEGHNVWLIEMTGGPYTDCEDCPNYKYQDLVDHYWPTLIAGVQEYSEQQKVHYVGHSNGCRAALSSLNEYSTGKNNAGYYWDFETGQWVSSDLATHPVDKFFGVACPIVLNGDTTFTEATRAPLQVRNGAVVKNIPYDVSYVLDANTNVGEYFFEKNSDLHVTLNDLVYFADPLLLLTGEFELGTGLITLNSLFESFMKAIGKDGSHDISRNLMMYYINLSLDKASMMPVEQVNTSKLYFYHSSPSDMIVPFDDQDYLVDHLNDDWSAIEIGTNLGIPVPKKIDHNTLTVRAEVTEHIQEVLK